jgi:hypothetical protein
MVMTIDPAFGEDMFDDTMEVLISSKVVIIEDVDMSAVEDLKDGHFRFIEDMNSACCLCVHSYFTRKLLLNINASNILFVNEGDI